MPARIFAASASASATASLLGLLGELLAQRQRLGERLSESARGGAGLGEAVLVADGETLGVALGTGELADALGLGGGVGKDARSGAPTRVPPARGGLELLER